MTLCGVLCPSGAEHGEVSPGVRGDAHELGAEQPAAGADRPSGAHAGVLPGAPRGDPAAHQPGRGSGVISTGTKKAVGKAGGEGEGEDQRDVNSTHSLRSTKRFLRVLWKYQQFS